MADRSVTYTFRGNFSNLGAGLTTMSKGVGDLGTKLTTLDKQGAVARRGLTTIGSTAGKVGLLAAAGVGAVIVSAANFEQAMSNVQAATHETADNMGLLRQAAIDAGQATQFSATEAASAVEELAKAGVSTKDILAGGLTGAMDLAAAGGLEVADAAQIAATALTQFQLSGSDVPHVADLLAAAAGKAQGDVSDMSMALKQSGLVAAQMGVPIEETTGTLAAFASAGLLGSDAGTSFRTMLLRLANPSVESAKLMKSLGIEAYDAQGNFVGMASVAGQLQTAFEGKTQAERDSALATIFGSDAIRAASVLYKDGAQGIDDWTDKVNDQGYAAETAAIKMDNLKGDLEQLKGSLETALIGAGGSSQGPLRSLVQGATSAVNAFNDMPGPMQSTATALGAITAVTGGGLWFGTKVIRGITDTKQALKDLGGTGDKAALALKGVGVAAGTLAALETVGALIGEIEKKFDHALPSTEALTRAILNLGSAEAAQKLSEDLGDLGDAVDGLNAGGLQGFADNLNDAANAGGFLGNALKGLDVIGGGIAGIDQGRAKDLREYAASIDAVDKALAGIVTTGSAEQGRQAFASLATAQGLSADQQKALLDLLPTYNNALDASANQATLAAGATDQDTAATGGLGAAAEDAGQKIADLVKSMQDQKDAAVSAFDAITGYRQAMKDAAKQAEKNNAGINGNSKAALENRDKLGNLVAAWNNLDQTVTDNVGKFKTARDNFVQTAQAMGVPKKAAEALWREMAKIPTSIVTRVSAETGQADAALRSLKARMDAIKSKDVYVNVHTSGGVRPQGGQVDPEPGQNQTGHPRSSRPVAGRSSASDGLVAQNAAKAAYALKQVADEADDAAGGKDGEGGHKGLKGLKEQLHHLEARLAKVSKAADAAHDALQGLRDQRSGLASSVTGSLEHDPFSGGLDTFNAQVGADTADAQAVLAALQTLVRNGLDPHSVLFQRLAASGNVSLIQQFAALSRAQLAAEAATFAAGQAALGAVGQFAGGAAFDDLIRAQSKVTNHLDDTVHHLAHQVNQLEKAIKDLPKHVKDGAKDGTKEGQQEANSEHHRRTASYARTGR